eukprot:GILJ01006851.1.p1 GENE.GILJ01006851.1~~GILJ01006851.1.p1  ORF type:complete len:1123 (+),score=176.22 GILJ01006851.1:301-3369(+)
MASSEEEEEEEDELDKELNRRIADLKTDSEGEEKNVTVASVRTVEACVGLLNPPDDEDGFSRSSASGEDEQPLVVDPQVLYRRDLAGIVVYDSRARIHDIQTFPEKTPDTLTGAVQTVADAVQSNPGSLNTSRSSRPPSSNRNQRPLSSNRSVYRSPIRSSNSESEVDREVSDMREKQKLLESIRRRSAGPLFTLFSPRETTLVFESRFESGNLNRAVKVSEREYNLVLETDVNTKGHIQWFYFAVSNTTAGQSVQFNLVNFLKPDSLYNEGMQPVVFSEKAFLSNGKQWFRAGTDISYFSTAELDQRQLSKYRGGSQSASERNSESEMETVMNGLRISMQEAPSSTGSKVSSPAGVSRLSLSGVDCERDRCVDGGGEGGQGCVYQPTSWYPAADCFRPGVRYFTLSFTYTFQHSNDTVFFAHCIPYTHRYLLQRLKSIEDSTPAGICQRSVLCRTIEGRPVDVLTITNPSGDPEREAKKRGVIITARTHPGETNGSWMMQGVLDFLTGPTPEANTLRHHLVFKVIPMMNPDGVVHGNYRCNLAGVDLNRRWKKPSPDLHPTVFHTKAMIKAFAQERKVILFCDLHGHSRKRNVFTYGCRFKRSEHADFHRLNYMMQVFPRMLSKRCGSFTFEDCRFRCEKSKESTARIVVFRECNIWNSLTLEASFYGPTQGPCNGSHFDANGFASVGADVCTVLLDYCGLTVGGTGCTSDEQNPSIQSTLTELMTEVKMKQSPVSSDESGGSDSDPSEDNIVTTVVVEKRKRLKKKKKKKSTKRKAVEKPPQYPTKKEQSPSPVTVQVESSPQVKATGDYIRPTSKYFNTIPTAVQKRTKKSAPKDVYGMQLATSASTASLSNQANQVTIEVDIREPTKAKSYSFSRTTKIKETRKLLDHMRKDVSNGEPFQDFVNKPIKQTVPLDRFMVRSPPRRALSVTPGSPTANEILNMDLDRRSVSPTLRYEKRLQPTVAVGSVRNTFLTRFRHSMFQSSYFMKTGEFPIVHRTSDSFLTAGNIATADLTYGNIK